MFSVILYIQMQIFAPMTRSLLLYEKCIRKRAFFSCRVPPLSYSSSDTDLFFNIIFSRISNPWFLACWVSAHKKVWIVKYDLVLLKIARCKILHNPMQLGHWAELELLLSEIISTNISYITLFTVRALANSLSLWNGHVFWLYNLEVQD